MTEATADTFVAETSQRTAYRLLWLAVPAFGVGFGWDRRWHATHPFEDFFSPAVTGALDLYLRAGTP